MVIDSRSENRDPNNCKIARLCDSGRPAPRAHALLDSVPAARILGAELPHRRLERAMDPTRFDALTKTLDHARSRRPVLTPLGATTLSRGRRSRFGQ